MKKNYFALAIISLVTFFTGCQDEITPISHDLTIVPYSNGTADMFAKIPVYLRAAKSNNLYEYYPGDYLWLFGDGEQSTEIATSHTYKYPGQYKVTVIVAVHGGKRISKDTTITILPRLNTYGSPDAAENGIYLYQNSDHDYNVLYSSNGNSGREYFLLRTSETFDSLYSKKLPITLSDEATAPAVQDGDYMVVLGGRFIKFDKNGTQIFNEDVPNGYMTQVFKAPSGFCLTGQDELQKSYINQRSADGKSIFLMSITSAKPSFNKLNTQFESPDILNIHYLDEASSNSGYMNTFVTRRTISGGVLFEKPFPIPSQQSLKLSSGQLLIGYNRFPINSWDDSYTFTLVNASGNPIWTFGDLSEQLYPTYYYPSLISAFEKDGFTYIFYDNMKGVKLTSNGNIVWKKRFSLTQDTFQSAILNHRGNFVLLGAHQYDYKNNMMTNEYSKRDLLLMEIDANGEIVN